MGAEQLLKKCFSFVVAQQEKDGSLSAYGFPPGGFQVQYGSHEDAEASLAYVKKQSKGKWKVWPINQ